MKIQTDNWKSFRLKDIAVISTGSTPPTKNRENFGDEYGFATPGDICGTRFIKKTAIKLSNKGIIKTRLAREGSVLFVCIGSTIGKVAQIAEAMAYNQQINACTAKEGVDQSFFYYALLNCSSMVRRMAGKQAVPIVNKSTFQHIQINLPPIAEQRKIAEILSAQDRVIELKTKLLEEKKRLKKYLCQVLLSGKRRFSSFSDKWKQNPLSDFLTESRLRGSNGKTAKKLTVKLWGKGVTEKKETLSGSENTAYFRRTKGQFIYSKLDFLNGAFGIIPDELDGYESTIDLPAFDVHHINTEFLLLCVSDAAFYKRNGAIANGGRKAKRINPNDFLSFCINHPSLSEQTSIVDVFRRVDEVIALCENEIKQEQFKKKALMQQLLMGKIRVTV